MSNSAVGGEGEAAKRQTPPSPQQAQTGETLEDNEAPLATSLYGYLSKRQDARATRKSLTKRPKATHDQVTRRWLAVLILGVVGILHLGVFASFLFGQIDGDGLTKAIAALAGPQSLAAAAVGFYYADRRGSK